MRHRSSVSSSRGALAGSATELGASGHWATARHVPLELGAEIRFVHLGLLASKLGKKTSTNLGAI